MDKFHYNFAGLKILEQPVLHKLGNFHSGVIEDSSLLACQPDMQLAEYCKLFLRFWPVKNSVEVVVGLIPYDR